MIPWDVPYLKVPVPNEGQHRDPPTRDRSTVDDLSSSGEANARHLSKSSKNLVTTTWEKPLVFFFWAEGVFGSNVWKYTPEI